MKEKKRYQPKVLSAQTCQEIESQVYEQAEIIVSANYFVVDVKMELENGRWYLRVYLDHPNPAIRVNLDDCADISQALSPMIDEAVKALENFPYSLEVSSPGLFRKLSLPREFRFYADRRIEITPKGKDAFIGFLSGFDDEKNQLLYRESHEPDAEVKALDWDAKKTSVCLSPDLTQPVEPITVPRRITRYD